MSVKFVDIVKQDPNLINNAIDGAEELVGGGNGEQKADLAIASVVSVAASAFPQYSWAEAPVVAGLERLIELTFRLRKTRGLVPPALPNSAMPAPTPTPAPALAPTTS